MGRVKWFYLAGSYILAASDHHNRLSENRLLRYRKACSGQAMVEYIIIAGLLMAALGILTVFLVTFKEYGGRILALVSSEYP